MKALFIVLPFFIGLTSSCGSSAVVTVDQNPHAKAHQDMHVEYKKEILKKTDNQIDTPEEEPNVKIIESYHPKAKHIHGKWQKGIRFFAMGHEPSWSFELDKDNLFRFKSDKGHSLTSDSMRRMTPLEPNVITYLASSPQGDLMIRLTQEKCTDEFTDFPMEFKVSAELKLEGELVAETYEGCGDYVPDPRLNGKWKIIRADTLLIQSDRFENRIPEVTLDVYDGLVFGNDGCNSFRGSLSSRDQEIIFGMMAGTLMACPHMDLSSMITSSFVNKKLKYKFQKDLILIDDEKEVLVLRRLE